MVHSADTGMNEDINVDNPFSLTPGENCWKKAKAKRVAVAVDGEAYFRAVREAILGARQSVFILGWDMHSRLKMVRDDAEHKYPIELGDLLDFVARKHKVNVYILTWDFSSIYTLERESRPTYVFNKKTHPRVQFHLDNHHPIGASQHQKVVVVDDSVAFSGGFDLSKWRWDSPEHAIEDPRRLDPDSKPYPPFHDIQMLVDGDAAKILGELARDRWRQATGRDAQPVKTGLSHVFDSDPWPNSLTPQIQDIEVGVARTLAEYHGRPAVQEVKQLYLDMISAAQNFIYIENQYLTSHKIQQALIASLQRPEGPEIIIVMPEKTGGWLEQHTMDVLRSRLVKKLQNADHKHRLRLYYPQLATKSDVSLMVHAKLMIVDDCLLRVASSNLSNRSMGLDSECDLVIQIASDSGAYFAIQNLRRSLICEHLGIKMDQLTESEERHKSLINAIESHQGGERTLQTLHTQVTPEVDQLVPESALIDPEQAYNPDYLVNHFVPNKDKPHTVKHFLKVAALLTILISLIAAWRWTPLNEWLSIENINNYIMLIQAQSITPWLVVLAFAMAATLAVPLTLLVVGVILGFGASYGFAYALSGALLSAILSYLIGQWAGHNLLRRYSGNRLHRISKKLSERGVLTIITMRIIPIAPFEVINVVAGASHIRLRDFILGSFIGFLPGMLAIALFTESVLRSIKEPSDSNLAWVLFWVMVIIVATIGLRKWLLKKSKQAENDKSETT